LTINIVPKIPAKYKTIGGLANWVQGIFIISGLLSVVSFFSGYLQSELINKFLNGGFIKLAEARANDNRELLIGRIQFAFIIIGIIIFLMWIYRANKNLHAFDNPVLKFSPGWTVGWFFIPFASLWKPYQAVSEISKASDPNINPALSNVDDLPTPAIVVLWWAFFLFSNFVSQISFRLLLHKATATELLTSTYAYMVSDVINLTGIIITVFMVKKISESQELRFNKSNTITLEEVPNGQ
jgi:hypothetical protein